MSMTDDSTGTVARVMSAPPVTSPSTATLAQAAARMGRHRVGSIIVVDDGGRVVGILTERDLVHSAASGIEPTTAVVGDWMTKNPDTVGPSLDAAAAFAWLDEHEYRHLPVLDEDRLVGVVSMRDLMRVAKTQPVTHPGQVDAPPGLSGVVVAETKVGDVRGGEGFYHYRQHSAIELAERRTLEEAWYLLFEGRLPTEDQRARFLGEVRALRTLPDAVRPLLPPIATAGTTFVPLDALRSAVSATATALDFRPCLDIGSEELRADAMRICALVPTLIAALYRLHSGREPVEPHPELSSAANYLYMLSGQVPDPDHARAVEQYLIATADHGFNASTFTARIVTSTGADLAGAVVSAIAALSRPPPRRRPQPGPGHARRHRAPRAGRGVDPPSGARR